ncbi:unnamed protein product [Lampetra planeri]
MSRLDKNPLHRVTSACLQHVEGATGATSLGLAAPRGLAAPSAANAVARPRAASGGNAIIAERMLAEDECKVGKAPRNPRSLLAFQISRRIVIRNEGFMAAFVPLSGTPQTPRPASKRPRTTGRCVDSRDPTTLCRVQQPWQTRPKVNLDTAGLVSTHRRPRSRAEASPTQ